MKSVLALSCGVSETDWGWVVRSILLALWLRDALTVSIQDSSDLVVCMRSSKLFQVLSEMIGWPGSLAISVPNWKILLRKYFCHVDEQGHSWKLSSV